MEEKWMELEERKVLKQSSDSSFRSSRAPQDGNRQQAEQAATGNRQHGLSVAGLGNYRILSLMFIIPHGIFTTEIYLLCFRICFFWSTKKKLSQRISLMGLKD